MRRLISGFGEIIEIGVIQHLEALWSVATEAPPMGRSGHMTMRLDERRLIPTISAFGMQSAAMQF